MGHQSRARKTTQVASATQSAKIIHTTKLFGGRETAEDVHRQHAWHGARCNACGDREVVVQVSTHMLTKELIEKNPHNIVARIMAQSEDGTIPSWQSKYGRMTMVGVAYACTTHQRALETTAARGPSSVLVEIDRGPGKDKIVAQVPAGYLPDRPKA